MSNSSKKLWLLISAVALLVAAISFDFIWRHQFWYAHPTTVTVSGLSMSPALRCAHFKLHCSACGRVFPVAAEHADGTNLDRPPQDAQCPQCGVRFVGEASARNPGDLLRIEPSGNAVRYERFDVVAFGLNDTRVKRVVGLPGERVEIDGGDVIINGQVLRKTLDEFFDTAIVVATVGNDAHQSPALEELFSANGWEYANAITDFNSFDQRTSRSLNHVGDIIVTMKVAFESPGQIELQINDGWQRWYATLRLDATQCANVQINNISGVHGSAPYKSRGRLGSYPPERPHRSQP